MRVGAVLKIKEALTTVAVSEIETKVDTTITMNTSNTFFGDYSIADDLIAKASDNLGIRYRSGGTSRAGFDCSGLMCSAFSALDIKLPRSSNEMSNIGIRVTPTEAKKGDLIFFKTRGSGRINHVGMVVDVVGEEIKFIHSSTNNGVIISSTKEGYYHRNFAQVNRVLK
jgi:cell wall-associated NlpC family hydrolase